MNLTVGDARDLPLAAALLHNDEVLAQTPEWRGAGPGTVTYSVRRARLLINTVEMPPHVAALSRLLLQALDEAAASAHGLAALQLRMLAASLRVVSGEGATRNPTSGGVLDLAIAGIAARTALRVVPRSDRPCAVTAPEVAALVAVQLAANAERHDDAATITLIHDAFGVHVEWRGRPSAVRTSRLREHRARWGLGFARMAADSLGATLHPPHSVEPGVVRATLELGVPRLALPLAALSGRTVQRATRTWDEETSLPAGAPAHRAAWLNELAADARRNPGVIVASNGWTARRGASLLWVAMPPSRAEERARDVISGLVHEDALLRCTDELRFATIRGLALLLEHCLGSALPVVDATAWRRRLARLSSLVSLEVALPASGVIGAVDADATWVLMSHAEGQFEVGGDQLWLRVKPERVHDPVVQAFATADGRIVVA